jgi:hypothetical protein
MKTLKLIKDDGTVVDVPYRPTTSDVQGREVGRYLISKGHRPSEAAMQVGTMSEVKLRKLYMNLVLLGDIKQ